VAGDQDHLGAGGIELYLGEDLDAAHVGEEEVADDDVETLAGEKL